MPVATLRDMRVHAAPCDRYRLRVTTWGGGAPPHAIVLPGLMADWRALAPQIRTLRRLGWTVHVVDLPGFALQPSLAPADATVVRLADYVAKVMADLSIPHALVLGHSLGCGVALQPALRRPALVSGLVLIAPSRPRISLHSLYGRHCAPPPGRALPPPAESATSSIRRYRGGGRRRGDAGFAARRVRHGTRNGPRSLSAPAIIWANQPRRWDK